MRLDWLIYWQPWTESEVLKLCFHLKCYVCHRWALEDGLWNFDGQGCSQSFGAGFKQMEASCVFWKLKAPRRVSLMCVWNLETLSEQQTSCAFCKIESSQKKVSYVLWDLEKLSEEHSSCVFWNFEGSHKNKLHVCSNTSKLLLSQKAVKTSSASKSLPQKSLSL